MNEVDKGEKGAYLWFWKTPSLTEVAKGKGLPCLKTSPNAPLAKPPMQIVLFTLASVGLP